MKMASASLFREYHDFAICKSSIIYIISVRYKCESLCNIAPLLGHIGAQIDPPSISVGQSHIPRGACGVAVKQV